MTLILLGFERFYDNLNWILQFSYQNKHELYQDLNIDHPFHA